MSLEPYLRSLPSHARKAARTRNTDTLRDYATGADRQLRHAAVFNSNLPADLLTQLALDYEWSVRAAVWQRATVIPLPVEVLQAVFNAPNHAYRNQVPEQANCTREMHQHFWRESSILNVRARVALNTDDVNILAEAVRDRTAKIRSAVPRNPHHTEEMETSLLGDKSISVILSLAENTQNPDVIRHLHASHPSREVNEAIVGNNATPRDILMDLASSPIGWIGVNFVRSRGDDLELMRVLAANSANASLDEVLVRESGLPLQEKAQIAAESRSIRVRQRLLSELSSEDMVLLAASDDERIRRLVSRHLVKATLA